MNNYGSNDIEVIYDDIKRIQKRPEMYIGYRGNMGFLHLIKEGTQNSVDEPTCRLIKVSFDEREQSIILLDNGRGIPHDMIESVCTVIQSSGKFDKGTGNPYGIGVAGLNGVGLKAINALSNYLHVTSSREGKKFRVSFVNGAVVSSDNLGKTKELGTMIEFQINEAIMGKCTLSAYEVYGLMQELAFLNKGLVIEFHARLLGKDGDLNEIFCYENGLVDYLYSIGQRQLEGDDCALYGKDVTVDDAFIIPPIYIEHNNGTDTTPATMAVEIAFSYSMDFFETLLSYSNNCTTVEGGSHVKGLLNGISKTLVKYVRGNLSDREAKSISITNEDTRTGLMAIIHAKHISPDFVGQVKEKDMNEEYFPYITDVVSNYLKEWIRDNPKDAKRLSDYIKKMAKIREDGIAAKVKIKRDVSIFSKDRPKKYVDYTDKKAAEPELIIIEGDSAGGSAREGRDPKIQAVYPLRGVPKNTFGLDTAKILDNVEFKGLLQIIGAGAGKSFDITQCRFRKIIIMTDSDVDGFRIFSLICTFFLECAPEIIKAGYLYKAVAPLYRTPKGVYYRDKKEYLQSVESEILRKVKVAYGDGTTVSKEELLNIMFNNKRYVEKLTKLASRKSVHPTLLEYIICAIDRGNLGTFSANMAEIKKNNPMFRFINLVPLKDGNICVEGTFERESPVVNLFDIVNNDRFVELHDYIHNVPYFEFIVDSNRMSLGQMLSHFQTFSPSDLTRYKGLGEMDGDQLAETTMSPESRTLIQLTFEDVNREIEQFHILHGNGSKAIEERKKMMAAFEIDLDDLDN